MFVFKECHKHLKEYSIPFNFQVFDSNTDPVKTTILGVDKNIFQKQSEPRVVIFHTIDIDTWEIVIRGSPGDGVLTAVNCFDNQPNFFIFHKVSQIFYMST